MRAKRPVVVALVVGLIASGALASALIVSLRAPPLTPAQLAAQAAARRARLLLAAETNAANDAKRLVAVRLPKKLGAPAPATPGKLFAAPLARHEVVGFVPYWELGALDADDVRDATVLVYSSVCAGPSGALLSTGQDCVNGLADLDTPGFGSLVAAAHAADTRVLLSVESTSDTVIESLDARPGPRAARLADKLDALVSAYGLDGVNIDLEGTRAKDRQAFVRFVADLTAELRRGDPHGEILLDTYASSAASPPEFFDVAKLARYVDALFVEGYGMDDPSQASANSPLQSPVLGYSDVQSLIQYEKLVPAAKIILGVPFYGNDFETRSSSPGAQASAAAPDSYTYAAIVSAGYSVRWDPRSETPFSEFRRDGTWHEIWFDDPVSIALKTALAAHFHIAGVGAWAFGMEGAHAAMFEALTGGSEALKLPLTAS